MASTMAAVNPIPHANPVTSTSAGSGSSSGQAATISANDFLTLLVTEMKNQDPTAQTDPNQYINQLVQVNSLEQLIQINQNLSTAIGGGNSGGAGSASGAAVKAARVQSAMANPAAQSHGTHAAADSRSGAAPSAGIHIPAASGNLSVPPAIPAAQRVANALSGRK